MKKHLFLILIIAINFSIFAQNRTFFTLNLDLSVPQSKSYFFNTNINEINNTNLKDTGFLLNNYGLGISYNYLIINKRLSIGVLSGVYSDTKQKFSHFRIGGGIKFFLIKNCLYNFDVKLAENVSFDSKKFKSGVNFKLGFGIPIYHINDNNKLLLNLFWEQNFYTLDGSHKLLGLNDEIPRNLTVHSYGFGFSYLIH